MTELQNYIMDGTTTHQNYVHIIITNPSTTDQDIITTWLSYPERCNIIFADNLEDGRKQALQQKYSYAIVSWSGVKYYTPLSPASNIADIFHLWVNDESSSVPIKGIEEQTLFCDLQKQSDTVQRFTNAETVWINNPSVEQPNLLIYRDIEKYSDVVKYISQLTPRQYDKIYAPASGSIGELIWGSLGSNKHTKMIFCGTNKHYVLWKQSLYGLFGAKPTNGLQLLHMTKIMAERYGLIMHQPEHNCNDVLWSDDIWADTIQEISDASSILFNWLDNDISLDAKATKLIYVGDMFIDPNQYTRHTWDYIRDTFNKLLATPNTTVIGMSPLKEVIVHENHSR